jgi:hypothetical protein
VRCGGKKERPCCQSLFFAGAYRLGDTDRSRYFFLAGAFFFAFDATFFVGAFDATFFVVAFFFAAAIETS